MRTRSRGLLCILFTLALILPAVINAQQNESAVKETQPDSETITPATGLVTDEIPSEPVRTSAFPDCEASISIASDSTVFCTYRAGAPITFAPADVYGPAQGEEPQDVGGPTGKEYPRDSVRTAGGGPRDTIDDCEHELLILKDFMASRRGEELGWNAKINAEDAADLAGIQNRIRELETKCPERSENYPGNAGESINTKAAPAGTSISIRHGEKNGNDAPADEEGHDFVLYVKAASPARLQENRTVAGQKIKLLAAETMDMPLPGEGVEKPQTGYDQEPIQGITDRKGDLVLQAPGPVIGLHTAPVPAGTSFEIHMDTTAQESINAELGDDDTLSIVNALPKGLRSLLSDTNIINGNGFLTFTFPSSMSSSLNIVLARIRGVVQIQTNFCRSKQDIVNDPLYAGNKAWGQRYDNQWAIKRIGLSNDEASAWNLLPDNPQPVTIAVIDTGLDWHHPDIDWKNIWRNPGETPGNNIDDDGNGYVDDIIGWDFIGNNNKPWDHDGHGTLVTGVIAAAGNNNAGIAGINPHARIMVLKALNSFGHTRASYLAKAIVYAVDNGARIINLSAGGDQITAIEEAAVQYAVNKGVFIVVAAGNRGSDVSTYGIAGFDEVMTVAATGLRNEWQSFSNWGPQIDIAAPGIEVLSLRARRTDTMRDLPEFEYVPGTGYIGKEKRYYRAEGTSLSASIVCGIASLLMSKNPHLTAEQVGNILKKTAKDIELTGFDLYTGHGLVNAVAAMGKDSDLFIEANISGIETVQADEGTDIQVKGTALADQLSGYEIELGAGEEPGIWKTVFKGSTPVEQGILGTIEAKHFKGATVWILQLRVIHKNGEMRAFRYLLNLGK